MSKVRSEVGGTVNGSLVQAGSIHPVSFGGGGPSPPLVPRQLPLAVRDFVGRAEHLAALDALLSGNVDDAIATGAVVISALDGTGGANFRGGNRSTCPKKHPQLDTIAVSRSS